MSEATTLERRGRGRGRRPSSWWQASRLTTRAWRAARLFAVCTSWRSSLLSWRLMRGCFRFCHRATTSLPIIEADSFLFDLCKVVGQQPRFWSVHRCTLFEKHLLNVVILFWIGRPFSKVLKYKFRSANAYFIKVLDKRHLRCFSVNDCEIMLVIFHFRFIQRGFVSRLLLCNSWYIKYRVRKKSEEHWGYSNLLRDSLLQSWQTACL